MLSLGSRNYLLGAEIGVHKALLICAFELCPFRSGIRSKQGGISGAIPRADHEPPPKDARAAQVKD